ncbi:hypothetical protein FGO68_gene6413 [Halteria grandinella]|uniref:Uncharacterized protein n=1 Tax=Halteria grandinella TaxID=5974 RepID=A0A8J8NWQ9_HALGN|nr:hypothetical protein FGO68_gene6413 [Halteria grandinella]
MSLVVREIGLCYNKQFLILPLFTGDENLLRRLYLVPRVSLLYLDLLWRDLVSSLNRLLGTATQGCAPCATAHDVYVILL